MSEIDEKKAAKKARQSLRKAEKNAKNAEKRARKEAEQEDIFGQFQSDHKPTKEQLSKYYPAALAVTAVPLYLYVTIFGLELQSNLSVFVVVTFLSAAILTLAYHNIAYWLTIRLTPIRESQLSLSKMDFFGDSGNKKARLEKQKIKQAEITNKETMIFSILYNNALFLFVFIFLAFFIFKSVSPAYNYVLSVSLSATVLSLFAAATL